MDEKILAAINKVKALAAQNPEFHQAMQNLFGNTGSASQCSDIDQRIGHIEKYLGLDFYVDSMKSIIDYSYIEDENIRTQLTSDNREMLRFRYGTRYHEILFEEFCRYALLQAEMLLNYYYSIKFPNDAEAAIKHIREQNPGAKIDENVSELLGISFNVKLWAFCDEFGLKRAKDDFQYVREVRNRQSHRHPPEGHFFSLADYQQKLIRKGIKLRKDGSFDHNETKKDDAAYAVYNNELKNTPQFKTYNFLIWMHRKPYDEVCSRLKGLSDAVRLNLRDKSSPSESTSE